MKIDVIITWVDGADPEHQKKRAEHLPSVSSELFDYSASKSRFDNSGEIYLCIASILEYANFVRKIWIVTDKQRPDAIDYFVNHGFCSEEFIEVVDHRVIFRDLEEVLPTFNSLSIETVLWRIPGLADHFIYLNDDLLINRPTEERDWFIGGRPRLKCSLQLQKFAHLEMKRRKLKYRVFPKLFEITNSYPEFYLNQECGARLTGCETYFWRFGHVPHPVRTATMKDFYESNYDVMLQNIGPRFRAKGQHHPIALANHLEVQKCNLVPELDASCLYIDFLKHGIGETRGMHLELGTFRSACIQSLNMIDDDSFEYFIQAMSVKFGHFFDEPFLRKALRAEEKNV